MLSVLIIIGVLAIIVLKSDSFFIRPSSSVSSQCRPNYVQPLSRTQVQAKKDAEEESEEAGSSVRRLLSKRIREKKQVKSPSSVEEVVEKKQVKSKRPSSVEEVLEIPEEFSSFGQSSRAERESKSLFNRADKVNVIVTNYGRLGVSVQVLSADILDIDQIITGMVLHQEIDYWAVSMHTITIHYTHTIHTI